MFLRKRFAHELHVVEHRLTTAPGLVPVITDAPNVLCGFWIGQDCPGSLVDQVAIVVPHNNLLRTETFAFDRWPKIVLQKISLVLGGKDARLPFLRRHRLVLNTDAPDRYAFALVGTDKLHKVVGPRL